MKTILGIVGGLVAMVIIPVLSIAAVVFLVAAASFRLGFKFVTDVVLG